jgi:hypothetical protein
VLQWGLGDGHDVMDSHMVGSLCGVDDRSGKGYADLCSKDGLAVDCSDGI